MEYISAKLLKQIADTFSKEAVNKDLEKEQPIYRKLTTNSGIIACKYCSIKNKVGDTSKVVCMFSTRHKSVIVDIGKHHLIKNAV